jgi:hypothetical protein
MTEGFTPILTAIPHLGVGHLLANAMTAFMLNVVAVWLVGVGGGLVLTLAGVFKVHRLGVRPSSSNCSSIQDILLITGSVIIFRSDITPVQIIGMPCVL